VRAGTGACPYGGGDGGGGDFDDSVNMIGHDNKLMDAKSIVINGDFMPYLFNHFPCIIQNHFTIINIPKQTQPILGKRCNMKVTVKMH